MGNRISLVDRVKAVASGTEVGDGFKLTEMENRLFNLSDCIRKALRLGTEVGDGVERTEILNLKVELKLVRTFLIYVSGWHGAAVSADRDEVVPELGSLVIDIEAAFIEAMMDSGIEEAQLTPSAISKLQERITLLRRQIKAAYRCIIFNNINNNCSMESLWHHRPIMSNYHLWKAFAESLETNLLELCSREDELVDGVVTHLRTMHGLVLSLTRFFCFRDEELEYLYFLTHFGNVLVRAAYISYTCWVDRKRDESVTQELIGMLFNLLKEFKPNTPELTQLFFRLYSWSEDPKSFYEFLIPDKDGFAVLWKGFRPLLGFTVYERDRNKEDNDLRLLSKEIAAAFTELGRLGYLFHMNETDPALVKLLWKIELLKAEVLLLKGVSWEYFERDNIISLFHNASKFLRTLSKAPNKPIWMYLTPMIREVISVYVSYGAGDKLFKLHDQIRLFKIELLLKEKELLNRNSSLMVNVKNQMETFYEGLIVISNFLRGLQEKHGKSILKSVESMAREVASNYYSFYDPERKFLHLLPELVKKVELVSAEIKENYLQVRLSSQANFPKTDGFGFIDFLFENLRYLLNSTADLIAPLRHKIQVVYKDIEFLRSFFRDVIEKHKEHSDLDNLVPFCIRVALEVEYLIDSFVVGDVLWCHGLWLSDLIEDMKLIKIKASAITDEKHGISVHDVSQSSNKVASVSKIPKIDEPMIDLADQTKLMIDMLTRGSLEQDVVSIVGMAGLGKTTLARKLYNDPEVMYHFQIRSWCCVSQAYKKRELLLQILGDIIELTDDILEMSDEDLEMKLYRCLKRNTYLIVIDDLWSIEAWNELSMSFPNDKNGSRILITSRLHVVALKIKADRIPHPLRLLSDDESWKLLGKKLFKNKDCPAKLVAIGKQIAKCCQGLPLSVVAISGLLERTEMTLDWWKQVTETLSSHVVNDPETRCRDILELSYKYLPHYLKPCFLYLGVFGEDKEIPVCKLKWLWIADGLVQTTGPESVEDLAEAYLRDLINRTLVIASKKRSSGGVKSCRVHDILRSLCLLKCKEDCFLQCITGYDELFTSSPEDLDYGTDPNYHCPTSITYEKRRISICSKRNHFVMSRPFGPHVRSLLYSSSSDLYPRCPYDISFIAANFKLLRVLDLESINMGNSFPCEIGLLVHLKFLALCGDIDIIPESINKLWNLEILLVRGLKGKVQLPNAIWRMAKLRHVHVTNNAALSLRKGKENSCQSCNLVSLSSPSLACGKDSENIMRMCPKLRKLKCSFSESPDGSGSCNPFPALDFLTELESLNVLYSGRIAHPRRFDFPLQLKKLTLSKFRLPWDCISEIGRLPNLEVLKLLSRAFEGKVWNMKGGEFLKLKFLKLDTLNIAQWNASSNNLPNLQHLILRSCRQLEEVPSGFGEIDTLEMIEVQMCRQSAEESVKRIKEEQRDMGNEGLQVLINRSDWD